MVLQRLLRNKSYIIPISEYNKFEHLHNHKSYKILIPQCFVLYILWKSSHRIMNNKRTCRREIRHVKTKYVQKIISQYYSLERTYVKSAGLPEILANAYVINNY